LKLRLSGMENRSSRRSHAAPRSVALLVLALLFALAFYYSSAVFYDKSIVYHFLEVLKVMNFQGVSKFVVQTIEKKILLFICPHCLEHSERVV
jgi:hypothetical protein